MVLYCVLGFVFISLIGSVLHFAYDWLNHNKFASFFVAVNESTWEHLKLALLPTFVWALIGLFFNFNNFAFACFVAVLTIVIVIPAIFYTYTKFSKKPILAIDISSFFVGIGLAMLFACLIMKQQEFSPAFKIIGICGLIVFAILFFVLTYYHPKLPFFKDPITNKYGRAGHHNDKNFGNDLEFKK